MTSTCSLFWLDDFMRRPWGAGGIGFWGAVAIAALATGLLGVALEMLVLRRLYQSPELFQLLATFGVVLIVQHGSEFKLTIT
jgi:branched-chain amino acid transport system permease protein